MTNDQRLSDIHENVLNLCRDFGEMRGDMNAVRKCVERHDVLFHGDGGNVVGMAKRVDRIEQDMGKIKKGVLVVATAASSVLTAAFHWFTGQKQ